MKKYAIGLIFLSILALIGCVGVTTAFEPLENLMKPPRVEGENLSIRLAFEENIGKNYLLKQPISGNYRSAYTFIDLTGDGENEVVVFYSMSNELGIVRMNVLDTVDGVWKSVADLQSVYNDIQEVAFSDLNGDGSKEIIVGWITLPDSYSKLLTVYEIKVDTDVYIEAIYSDNYTKFKVDDINSDGKGDILAISQTFVDNSSEYMANLLIYNNGDIVKKGNLGIDKSFSSLASVNVDTAKTDDTRRIYIDGYNADGLLSTDCICWNEESENFERSYIDDISVGTLSLRMSNVLCKDINSDGKIEIPTEEYFAYYDSDENQRGINFINWVNISDDKAELVDTRLIFSQYGFSFSLNGELFSKVIAENNSEKGVITFYSVKEDAERYIKDKRLFSITVKSDLDLESISELSFQNSEVSYIKGKFYFCRLYDSADSLGITKKEVINRIIAG